jgi:hypothetical protein
MESAPPRQRSDPREVDDARIDITLTNGRRVTIPASLAPVASGGAAGRSGSTMIAFPAGARVWTRRLTLIRIFEELRGLGYEGGYDAVRRYARRVGRKNGAGATAEAYVPLSFAPGEAYQFDWSHEVVLINGVTVTVKVAHVRLCHSRMLFVRAYPRESQEMVFDAHDRAFAFFKGACTRGIYDNMKTAVETVFVGKERHYNRRFLQMCSHYLVEPSPARRRRAGRRARSRTRSGWCASGSSRRGCGSRATRS